MAQLREGSVIKKPTGDEEIATIEDINNRPSPTKSDVGLGDVDNTSDINKPVSTATQTALDDKVNNSQVLTDVPSGAKFTDTVTTINDKTGTISKADIVALGIPSQDTNTTYSEITTAEIDTGTASTLRTITGRRVKYILDKVQGWIGGLTKSDVGLGNVDNTSDASKPISTATQTALNGKVNNSQVLTNVPSGAKFIDTITTINNKTGVVTKADITALGIPAQDTVYTHPSSHASSMIVESATKRFVSDTEKTTWNAKASKSVATTLSDGLMASTDKSKLNGIQAGAQVNTVTSVAGKTGAVTVTKNDVSLGNVLNYGLSTQLEAETGVNNAKYMTPLRTKQAIDKQVADKNYVTQSELGDAGFGDMVKNIYDTDNNGVVDNAEKVNGFTVETNVPASAKFTDTIYTHPPSHPASVITESTSRRFVSDNEKGNWNSKTKTITSATEPTLNVGDQWHREI